MPAHFALQLMPFPTDLELVKGKLLAHFLSSHDLGKTIALPPKARMPARVCLLHWMHDFC
jgi:hypothetical protein